MNNKVEITPKIKQEIAELIEKIGIKPETSLDDFLLRKQVSLYTTRAIDNKGQNVILRIAMSDDINQHLKKEIAVYHSAKENKLDSFPEILNFGVSKKHVWLYYRFIEGQCPGNVYQFKEDFDLSLILPFFREKKKIINKIDPNILPAEPYKEFSIVLNRIISEKQVGDSLISKVENQLREKITRIKPHTLTHGDLHAQNIIISPDTGKTKIIDWENCCVSSAAVDYSFVWIRSYNNQYRKILWQDMLKNNPGIEEEASIVFLFNLYRDYVEWHSVKAASNRLFKQEDIINGQKIEDIISDLGSNLEKFSQLV